MPPHDARAALAERQAELMRALTGQGRLPEGFDAGRLRTAAAALAVKRARAVARAWPALAHALGERFGERFAAYTEASPLPRHGGPLADGGAFVRGLAGGLPDAVRLEALAVDLRHARRGDGLVPRCGPALRTAWLRQRRRLVVALRLPWLGEWWLSIPLGRARPDSEATATPQGG